MIGRQRLDALPKQLPRGDRRSAKSRVTLAVEPGVLPGKLNTNRAEQPAIGGFDHLKFRQAFFQFVGRQTHGRPERLERVTVVHRRAADAENG